MRNDSRYSRLPNKSNVRLDHVHIYNTDFVLIATHFDYLPVSVLDTTKTEANMRRVDVNCVAAASAVEAEVTLPDVGEVV